MSRISDTVIDPYRPESLALAANAENRSDSKNRQSVGARSISFGKREVDGLSVQACLALVLMLVVGMVAVLPFDSGQPPKIAASPDSQLLIDVESGLELVDLLKEKGLWEIAPKAAIPPLILSGYPADIDMLDVDLKKRAFLHSLLPAALVALDEVRREKEALADILAKLPGGWQSLTFSEDFGSWGRVLSTEEIDFVLLLCRKYRTKRARQLVSRVDGIPLSLLLAQAAIESSWGSSRFALEGNNLFGIWTWGDKGIVPSGRDEGKTHKVAIYDSILDSVRAYIVMLNRLPHYRQFRKIREQTRNPLRLAEGLLSYSERGDAYVWGVQFLIESNDLHRFDECFLLKSPSRPPFKQVKLATTAIDHGPA